jgi:hypothetical protein
VEAHEVERHQRALARAAGSDDTAAEETASDAFDSLLRSRLAEANRVLEDGAYISMQEIDVLVDYSAKSRGLSVQSAESGRVLATGAFTLPSWSRSPLDAPHERCGPVDIHSARFAHAAGAYVINLEYVTTDICEIDNSLLLGHTGTETSSERTHAWTAENWTDWPRSSGTWLGGDVTDFRIGDRASLISR